MTTGYLSLCHVMIFEFQLKVLVHLNLIFNLNFKLWNFLKKISVLRKNNFEIWDLQSIYGFKIV